MDTMRLAEPRASTDDFLMLTKALLLAGAETPVRVTLNMLGDRLVDAVRLDHQRMHGGVEFRDCWIETCECARAWLAARQEVS